MANIIFTGVTESPFNYNKSLDYSTMVPKNLELGIRCELIYTAGQDLVTIGFHVFFRKENEKVLSYSVRLNFEVEDWSTLISGKVVEDIKKMSVVYDLVGTTSSFVRGSMYVRAIDTPMSKLVLPYIQTNELVNHLVVVPK